MITNLNKGMEKAVEAFAGQFSTLLGMLRQKESDSPPVPESSDDERDELENILRTFQEIVDLESINEIKKESKDGRDSVENWLKKRGLPSEKDLMTKGTSIGSWLKQSGMTKEEWLKRAEARARSLESIVAKSPAEWNLLGCAYIWMYEKPNYENFWNQARIAFRFAISLTAPESRAASAAVSNHQLLAKVKIAYDKWKAANDLQGEVGK